MESMIGKKSNDEDLVDLYHFRSCPHSTAVRWALSHKRVDTRLHDAPLLFRGELRKLSGQTWPPVLVHKGHAHTHLQACIRYLEDNFREHPLAPQGPEERAEMFMVSHWLDRAVHYVMVAVKYLNEENHVAAKRSILKGRKVGLLDRVLVELAPRVQESHLFRHDYVKSELHELQRIMSDCWVTCDMRLRQRAFLMGDALTYPDLQLFANIETLRGCVEVAEVMELPSLRRWKERIEGSFAWPDQ